VNIATALLGALKQHGAREIFGVPGDFALPFFKVVEESAILPLYTLSHEPGVGFAADAAARVSCGLGVAAVTYGAGALNMVNPVAAAYAEKSPVVVVSGAPGTQEGRSGLLLHHQAKKLDSQFRIYAEVTCDQVRIDDAARAPRDIARVLRSARVHSRPVYIELPRNMVREACAAVAPAAPEPVDAAAVAACVDEVLERLERAASPVLMVGVEVRRYDLEERVARLAGLLGLPVVTSFMGRGLLASTDAPLLGTYMGMAGEPDIAALVEESDALFLLGVIVSDTNFGVSARQVDYRRSIHAFDGHVTLGYHVYPRIPLEALVEALLQRLQGRVPRRRTARVRARPHAYATGLSADEAGIGPSDVACAINDLFAAAGAMPMAADAGDCLFAALEVVPTTLAAPGYYATMGFGVPAGLGIQASTGSRPLILVGDGAFQMTGWELGNCQRYGWDPIVIVFNNRSWEMLRVFQPESRFNDLSDWNFAQLAAGLGGDGTRVATRAALQAALRAAAARRGRFQLIEVMIPRGVVSVSLQRFVAGLRRLSERQQD
jgi:indolepyruvate decarboxylase